MRIAAILSIVLSFNLYAQTIKTLLNEVLETNPTLQEKSQSYSSMQEDLKISKAGYLPTIELSLGVGIENTEKTNQANNLPDKTTNFTIYQNSLKLTQKIFDGFVTSSQISQQKFKILSSSYDYAQSVNDIALELAQNYVEVLRNKELVINSQENVDIDTDILKKVQKLYDSGLTTLSEVNKIESSLALAKSNLVVSQNTLENTILNLEKTLGRKFDLDSLEEPDFSPILPSSLEEALRYGVTHNPSLLISYYNIKIARAAHKEKKALFYPTLDLEITESLNRNLSGVEGDTNSFKAMILLRYNLFNGFSDEALTKKALNDIKTEFIKQNSIKRNTIEKLSLSWVAQEKLQEQLIHLQKYKQFSLKTLNLYTREYDLGRRSLLDLLSAQNDLIGARTQIINSKYNALLAKYKVLNALGLLVDNIMGQNSETILQKNLEQIHFNLDQDKDLIPNNLDICDNSLSSTIKDSLGCYLQKENNITQIERYNNFTFYDNNESLDINGSQRFNNLILQLKLYGLKNIKIDIYTNAFNSSKTKQEMQNLSNKRGKTILENLINHGISKQNITLFSNADEAPISLENIKQNNSATIVVKKLYKEDN